MKFVVTYIYLRFIIDLNIPITILFSTNFHLEFVLNVGDRVSKSHKTKGKIAGL